MMQLLENTNMLSVLQLTAANKTKRKSTQIADKLGKYISRKKTLGQYKTAAPICLNGVILCVVYVNFVDSPENMAIFSMPMVEFTMAMVPATAMDIWMVTVVLALFILIAIFISSLWYNNSRKSNGNS